MPVTVLFVLITVAAIVANAGAAMADFTQADFALANSVRVGVPSTWLPALGTLKAAGAAGLLLGLLGVDTSASRPRPGWSCFSWARSEYTCAPASTATSSPRPATSCWQQRRWQLPSCVEDRAAATTFALAAPGALQTFVTARF